MRRTGGRAPGAPRQARAPGAPRRARAPGAPRQARASPALFPVMLERPDSMTTPVAKASENPSSDLVRRTFLDFFAARGHELVPSAPLLTQNDPTLLFTN